MKDFKNFCKGLLIFIVIAIVIFLIVSIAMSISNGHGMNLIAEWQSWGGAVPTTPPADPVTPPVEETSAIMKLAA